ncbi:triosephosphate isomerase [Staphylothermus marinus F1]|uniref:Triosephosphate isomerase n=1 Tax=Staphylothermus marinus (strain ATCC 43588 / DSM 3639 / JCM 9404 / F1) TaxID=399550 RepID=A3DMZ1_STAMF|nr:triose-phosphate isomerase [Staphylothermus marinus]ABN70001.1 triosephosphate isomerase [Staphylothermus marinus F1]
MSLKPIVAVNYKAYYPYSFGEHALRIARDAVKVWKETGVDIILAPPYTELYRVLKEVEGTDIKVFAQHADPVEPGAKTGYIPLEALKELGVHGVILNHSEHRLKLADINWLIKKAKKLGLQTLVCADVPETGAAVAVLEPDMVAVEPPELIGTGIPVSKAKPEVITRSVELIRKVNKDIVILTGAGISRGEDVYAAVKLGTLGVLVASAIVKSDNPYQVMKDMALNGLKALEK